MFDLSNLIPEETARAIYDDKGLFNALEENEQRVALQSLYFYDIELFAHEVTDRWVKDQASGEEIGSSSAHRELWSADQKKEDTLVIFARDQAKTTAESKIKTLHELIYKIEKSILLICAKGLGEKIVGDIKKELETNQKIRWLYGALVPIDNRKESKSEKWRQRYLQLLNGTELQSLSKGEPIRGSRPTRIKVDDPQSKKDVKNPLMANEFFTWFWTEVYPMLDDGGSVIVLGTLISTNCFANKLKKESSERDFKVIEYPAILNFDETKIRLGENNGKPWYYFDAGIGISLWPEKWSIGALERRYNKIGHKAFMQEYQNIPFIEIGTPVFKTTHVYDIVYPVTEAIEEWTIYVPVSEWKYGFIGLDFAKGSSRGDFQAGIIRDEKHRLLAQLNVHCSQEKVAIKVNKIIGYFEDVFIVPENNYGLAFLLAAQSYEWSDKIYQQMKMDEIVQRETAVLGFNTNRKTKPVIIEQLDSKYEKGNCQVTEELKEQIDYYYNDDRGGMNAISPYHDDLIIADALCEQGIRHGLSGPQLIVL